MANEVRVLVTADTKKAKEDIDSFSHSVGSGLATTAKIGAAAVVGLGAAAAGGLALSINAAANFEQAIDQVGAVANATEAEMAGLSDTALRIGRDTAYSATQAAAAMEVLAANGVSVADIMNGAADAAVALAAAGGTDLTTAADTASTAMAVWGLKAADMADVVNRLAGAANVSRFGVEDMSLAIAAGGGAAKTAGVEFGDFAAAIAAIAPSFSSGQDAGTSMKTFLANLVPDTKAAKQAFAELGITTADGSNRFFDASGNLKSMAEIAGILHEVTAGLSEEQKTLALNTMFGSDAMRAAAALSGLTAEEFQKLQDTMGNTDAAAVAAQRMDNFKGSMEALKGSLETIQIEIGSKFLPALSELARWAAENLPVAFAYIETEIAPKVAAAFDDISEAARRFVDAVGPYIVRFASEAQQQFSRFQGYYQTDIQPAFDNIRRAVEELVQKIRENWDKIGPIVEGVGELIENVVENIGNALQIIIDLLGGDWSGAWENTKQLIQGVFDFWKTAAQLGLDGLKLILSALKDIGTNALEGFRDGIVAVWDTWVKPFFERLPQAIADAIGDLFQFAWDLGKRLIEGFRDGILATWETVKGGITGVLDPRNWDIPGLSPMPAAMLHAGQIAAGQFVQGIWNEFTQRWDPVQDGMEAALRKIAQDAADLMGAGQGWNPSSHSLGTPSSLPPGPPMPGTPTGAYGQPLVWDPENNAWTYPWMTGGAFGARGADGGLIHQPFGGQSQPITVNVQIDRQTIATAVIEPWMTEQLTTGALQHGVVN